MKKSLVLLVLILSEVSFASNIKPTKITGVRAGPVFENIVLITVSVKPTTGRPSCHTGALGGDYAFDGTTDVGKMTLSLVLTAYASGRDVWVVGDDECVYYSLVENLSDISLY